MSIVLSLVMFRCIASRVGCIVRIMMIVMIMVMLVVFVVIIMIVMLTILVIITTIIFTVLVSLRFTVTISFSVSGPSFVLRVLINGRTSDFRLPSTAHFQQ